MDQDETIAFLADPATHGGAPVERIDTHGAVVFLAGQRAYKLKRAVRFPYMDFSTPALRCAACAAELHLNRRTAPQLYQAVLAVTRQGTRLQLGGDGPAVDCVVAMRRFDQDQLFDRMATAGRLTPPLVGELAEAIAAFHAAAEVRGDFGGAAALRWAIDINAAGFAAGSEVLDPAAVAAVNDGCRAALLRTADLLDARAIGGRLRRCHGDLHLRNICLVDGHPTMFDAVEFNDRIAIIDTLYDFAFLIMDLEHRGLRTLGNVAFNRYLDAADDRDGLQAWPLLLAVRAGVRAQTGCAAALAQSDPAKRGAAIAEAESYLDLAGRLLAPAPARIIAVGGLSGAGKSTLAQALAPEIGIAPGALVLRSDVMRKRMAGVSLTTRLPDTAYDRAHAALVYERLIGAARDAARAGHSVIVDAVFLRKTERDAVHAAAADAGVPFTGLWLDLPPAERVERIGGRRGDASDATAEIARRQDGFDPGALDWHRLDARGALDDLVRRARALLI